jgi:MFS transporter, DHA2 family, multidrug resistance protein
MCGTFMEVLDTSIANVALPHIAGSLSSTPEEATWAVTSYLVANAIVLPLTAWMGSRFGRKNFLITCTVLFTLASVLSGAATSLEMLVLARIFQGVGGGALQPTAQAVLLESFPPRQRGQAMAFYGMGIVVAPILGPIVGGYITDNYSWRWIFYINLPVGLFAVVMAWLFVEDPPFLKTQRTRKIDYLGFVSLALWVGALQIMLDKGQQEDWFGSTMVITLAVIFAVSLMFFLNWETTVEEPIVELKVFLDRNFAVAAFMVTVVGAVLYGSVTVLPLFLQNLLGYPAFDSGLAVAPRGMGAFVSMLIIGPLLARFDGRLFVGMGFFCLGVSNLWLSEINTQISIWSIVLPNVVQGVSIGFIFVPLTTLANAYLPVSQFGKASGIYNLMRNLGGGIGIALCTTAISRKAQIFQNHLVTHVNPYTPAYREFQERIQGLPESQGLKLTYGLVREQATMLSYINVYILMAYVCFACVPLVFLLRKSEHDDTVSRINH